MKLEELAQKLGCKVEGDAQTDIHGMAGIERAGRRATFVSNPRYGQAARTTRASAVMLAQDWWSARAGLAALALVRSGDPYLDFARALEFFFRRRATNRIHPTAVIAARRRSARARTSGLTVSWTKAWRSGATPCCTASWACIGTRDWRRFFAHAHGVVREKCRIGDRVILQNGVVIGGDGFGFAKQSDGRWYKILQAGITVLGDDVEIQANSCVDRATVARRSSPKA